MDCYYCRDGETLSRYNPLCTHCGRTYKEIELDKEILKDLCIPVSYMEKEWEENILLATHSEDLDNPSFKRYAKSLSSIIEVIKKDRYLNQSIFIASPKGYGKTTFGNIMLKHISAGSFSCLPIIDTDELFRIMSLKDKSISKRFDIDQLLEVDYLIIRVAKGENRFIIYSWLEDIIDKRAYYSKSTIVLSDFSIQELSRYDKYRRLESMFKNKSNESDRYKYPALISMHV